MPDQKSGEMKDPHNSLKQENLEEEHVFNNIENRETCSDLKTQMETSREEYRKMYKILLIFEFASTFVFLIAIVTLILFVTSRASGSLKSETLRTAIAVFGGIGGLLAGLSVTKTIYEWQRKSKIEMIRGSEKEFFEGIRQDLLSRLAGKVR